MNDCIWMWIGVCKGYYCQCESYTSINEENGSKLAEEYNAEIEKAIKPIREKFALTFWKNPDESEGGSDDTQNKT